MPSREKLIAWLKAFENSRDAVRNEISLLKELSFVPDDVIFHGLVYHLETGAVGVVVNGYE